MASGSTPNVEPLLTHEDAGLPALARSNGNGSSMMWILWPLGADPGQQAGGERLEEGPPRRDAVDFGRGRRHRRSATAG